MYSTELEKGQYYDFVLTKDCRPFIRDYDLFKLFYIDVTLDLCSIVGVRQPSDVLLSNISLTGYDNFFIPPSQKKKFVWENTGPNWASTQINWLNVNVDVIIDGKPVYTHSDVIDPEVDVWRNSVHDTSLSCTA